MCAKHHTVSMALHAPTLPAHSSNGHGRSACTHRAHRQRTGAYPSAASHDAALLAGLVDVGAHEGQARARRRRASKNRRASRHADGQRPCRNGRRFAAPVRARAPACPSRRWIQWAAPRIQMYPAHDTSAVSVVYTNTAIHIRKMIHQIRYYIKSDSDTSF